MKRNGPLAVIGWVMFGAIVSGSTCDNQDLSGRFVLDLSAAEVEAVHAYRQPYIGRLTIDFGLRNTSDSPSEYDIRVQAQTTGDGTASACGSATNATPRIVAAVPGDAEGNVDANGITTLTTFDRAHFLTFPSDADWGFVAVRIRRTSSYRFYTSSSALVLIRDDGRGIAADASHTIDCDVLGAVHDFTLTDGTYLLGVPEDGASVLVEERCEEIRTVPRTCPGATSVPFTRRTIELAPGGFVSGRINSEELGIGDQAVVALTCAGGAECAGELELFFLVQQLECRVAEDCTGARSCTEDGYCREVGEGGCAAAPAQTPSPIGLLALTALLARRRR